MVCTPQTKIDPACGANLCVGAVTQNAVISLISSQIANTMSAEIQKILQQSSGKSSTDNTSTVTATGPISELGGFFSSIASAIGLTLFGPIIAIVLFIIVIVVGVIIARQMGWLGSTAPEAAAQGVPVEQSELGGPGESVAEQSEPMAEQSESVAAEPAESASPLLSSPLPQQQEAGI
jgi:hypothetical protein